MQAYEVSKHPKAAPVFAADLEAVRLALRTVARDDRHQPRVYLVEIPDAKRERIAALNASLRGEPPARERRRAWRLSPRGALVELTPAQLAEEAGE